MTHYKEKKLWVEIINDARLYDGTPQMLTELTEHFAKRYNVANKNFVKPDVSGLKSVCGNCKSKKSNKNYKLLECEECDNVW